MVHIPFFIWHPPRLTEEMKRTWGEQINRLGTEHYLWQFRKWVGKNFMSPPDPDLVVLDLEPGPPKPRLDSFFSIVPAVIHPAEYLIVGGYLLFCLGCVLYIGDSGPLPLLWGFGLGVWGIWLASLFIGFHRYRKWLEGLQDGHLKGPPITGKRV